MVRLLASSLVFLLACGGDDDVPADAGSDSSRDTGEDAATADTASDAPSTDAPSTDGGEDAPADADVTPDAGLSECDYRSVDGLVVIEAEDLPLSEDWEIGREDAASGGAYIFWSGSAFNNDPTHGVMSVDVAFTAAGRYTLQWLTRVGMGDDATEHNDVWFRVDSPGFFGVQGDPPEARVYPKPRCEDDAFLSTVVADVDVASAGCPAGSSRDGWFKVYSSGALDWRWSSRTSDNDAHAVVIEVDAPGVLTIEFAARADFSFLDRIVFQRDGVSNEDARDLERSTTPCP